MAAGTQLPATLSFCILPGPPRDHLGCLSPSIGEDRWTPQEPSPVASSLWLACIPGRCIFSFCECLDPLWITGAVGGALVSVALLFQEADLPLPS